MPTIVAETGHYRSPNRRKQRLDAVAGDKLSGTAISFGD